MNENPQGRAGHWAQLEERGVYLGLRLMLMSYRVLGRPGFSLILYPVMVYFFLAGRTARQASMDYLKAVYGLPQGRQILGVPPGWRQRSEEHTSELQSLMRISYAGFCFKK